LAPCSNFYLSYIVKGSNGKKIIIIICADIIGIDKISTGGEDVMLFIYHFTPENYERHIASLTSDKNYGHSCYVYGSTIAAFLRIIFLGYSKKALYFK
jgi:hypothetical protein